MEIKNFIEAWITASNQNDTEEYLSLYSPDAILDDPSVGKIFRDHKGIRNYFDSYFIAYKTKTKMVHLIIHDSSHAHLEVEFTGDFPGGKIGGTFDFTFKDGKIAFVKADLIH